MSRESETESNLCSPLWASFSKVHEPERTKAAPPRPGYCALWTASRVCLWLCALRGHGPRDVRCARWPAPVSGHVADGPLTAAPGGGSHSGGESEHITAAIGADMRPTVNLGWGQKGGRGSSGESDESLRSWQQRHAQRAREVGLVLYVCRRAPLHLTTYLSWRHVVRPRRPRPWLCEPLRAHHTHHHDAIGRARADTALQLTDDCRYR